jgi:hypothetical protein
MYKSFVVNKHNRMINKKNCTCFNAAVLHSSEPCIGETYHEGVWVGGGTAALILNVDARPSWGGGGWVVIFTPQLIYPQR